MTFHLTGLHLTSKRGRGKTGLSEKDLILNRAGLFDLNPAQTELMTICPKHRKNLTTDWQGRKSRVCCYPCHKGQRKQLEVHRRVNALMSAEIHQLFNTVVPIGSAICETCRHVHYKRRGEKQQQDKVEVVSLEEEQETPLYLSSFEADAQHRPSSSSAPVQFDDLSQPNTSCAQAQFVDLNQPSTSSAQAQFVDLNQPSTSSSYAQSDDRHQPATSSSARVHFDDLRQPSTPASAQIEYETETTSSQSSQSTVPEQEVSVWEDEMELQQQKRHTLNETISELSGGRVSPLLSTLNTSWDDISSTQKKYYSRKAKEMISTTLSIISPGQEEELWNSIKPVNEGVVSKETVVLRRWGSSIQKFGFINGVDNVNLPPYRDSKS
ncbi:uncharacterized protein [Montipora capricornis]|uniref:uncharacterized protein n=1 Tax=Montipora capricornis TaxID=246305 RepID=UPI0035F20A8E